MEELTVQMLDLRRGIILRMFFTVAGCLSVMV